MLNTRRYTSVHDFCFFKLFPIGCSCMVNHGVLVHVGAIIHKTAQDSLYSTEKLVCTKYDCKSIVQNTDCSEALTRC